MVDASNNSASSGKKIIAVIPARGGSKRIPKKNVRPFKSKPMIAWTIEAALKTGMFEKVLVSTDDPEIAKIAQDYGAQCPFLRDNKADDISPVSQATLHALNQAQEHYGEHYDIVVQLMANCPLRSAKSISDMLHQFMNEDHKSMLTHTRYGWLNPWWACEIGEDKAVKPLFEEQLKARSQDLPALYCPTGAIWIARSDILREHESFHIPGKTAYVLDWKEAVDIDDMDDWAMAETVFDMLHA